MVEYSGKSTHKSTTQNYVSYLKGKCTSWFKSHVGVCEDQKKLTLIIIIEQIVDNPKIDFLITRSPLSLVEHCCKGS